MFYRYAHAQCKEEGIRTESIVRSGQIIAEVGNTGKNAVLPGHGKHLHLEIHKLDETRLGNTIVTAEELKEKIRMLSNK